MINFSDRTLAKTIFLYYHSQIARAMALFALTDCGNSCERRYSVTVTSQIEIVTSMDVP